MCYELLEADVRYNFRKEIVCLFPTYTVQLVVPNTPKSQQRECTWLVSSEVRER